MATELVVLNEIPRVELQGQGSIELGVCCGTIVKFHVQSTAGGVVGVVLTVPRIRPMFIPVVGSIPPQ